MWRLSVRERWRLYRRWNKDVCEGYRRTISQFQEQFEAGAKRLKDVKNMEDFEILKNADVVGMTTTGEFDWHTMTYTTVKCNNGATADDTVTKR